MWVFPTNVKKTRTEKSVNMRTFQKKFLAPKNVNIMTFEKHVVTPKKCLKHRRKDSASGGEKLFRCSLS